MTPGGNSSAWSSSASGITLHSPNPPCRPPQVSSRILYDRRPYPVREVLRRAIRRCARLQRPRINDVYILHEHEHAGDLPSNPIRKEPRQTGDSSLVLQAHSSMRICSAPSGATTDLRPGAVGIGSCGLIYLPTTRMANEPGFTVRRGPFEGSGEGDSSNSAAGRKIFFVLGSNAMVLALGRVLTTAASL